MTKYEVVDQPVELNGKTYPAGEQVDESQFKERPTDAPEEEKSELQSLLDTGHIKAVTE